MDAEQDRLARLYGEFGDAELLQLAGDRESLTDSARAALKAELGRRGLEDAAPQPWPERQPELSAPAHELETGFGAGIPGIFPGGAATVEQALEPSGEVENGRAHLFNFFDGIELSRACEALEGAGIEPEVRPVGIEGDARTGAPQHFEVWVAETELPAAQALLRERMGLFPPAEVETETGGDLAEDDELMPMASLESRAEAERILSLLARDGVSARLLEPDEGERQLYTIEVSAAELDRASALVADGLGLEAV